MWVEWMTMISPGVEIAMAEGVEVMVRVSSPHPFPLPFPSYIFLS